MKIKGRQYPFWLSCLAVTAVYLVLRVNLIDIPLDRDEGIFGYMGQLILDGGVPYKDAFEQKPPGVFYINALGLLFVPPTPRGIHLLLHFYNFLTLVSVFFLAKIFFRSSTAALWAGLSYAVFSASPAIQGFTASTEMFMLLPITLSLLFAVLAVRRQKIIFALLSGAAGALACWTKQTAVFSIFLVPVYLLAAPFFPGEEKETGAALHGVRWPAAWIGGAMAVSVVVVGYFRQQGTLDEFIYWSFTHSLLYSGKVKFAQNLDMLYTQMKFIFKGDFLPIIVGSAFGVGSILKGNRTGYFTLGFLVFSFLGTIPGYAYGHYFAQLAPAVALAAGIGFSSLLDTIRLKRGKVTATIVCATLLCGLPVAVHSQYYLEKSPYRISRAIFPDNPFPESVFLGEYIAERTDPNDTVFILGSEAQVLFYAKRRSANPYVLIYPLMSASYPRYKEFQRVAFQQIELKPPKYILIADLPTSLLADQEAGPPVFNKTLELVNREYSFEGLMVIGGERGRFVDPLKTPEILERDELKNMNKIHVYRKKR